MKCKNLFFFRCYFTISTSPLTSLFTNSLGESNESKSNMSGNDPKLILSVENPKFATYLIVSSLLVLKMMGLILLTIFHRMKNKVCISEEDTTINGATVGTHPDVERVRRAFQNDMENIPVFLVISLVYLWVPVPDWVVHMLSYLFLVFRALHSFVYAVYVVRQPARAICFFVSFAILGYMSIHVAIYGFVAGYLRQ